MNCRAVSASVRARLGHGMPRAKKRTTSDEPRDLKFPWPPKEKRQNFSPDIEDHPARQPLQDGECYFRWCFAGCCRSILSIFGPLKIFPRCDPDPRSILSHPNMGVVVPREKENRQIFTALSPN